MQLWNQRLEWQRFGKEANPNRRKPSGMGNSRVSETDCDVIFANANVITMDPADPCAGLIAVKKHRIAAVSPGEALEGLTRKGVEIVDCAGKTILPGFVDAHCHVAAYAESLISLNLSPKEGGISIAAIQDKIRRSCDRLLPGTWVRGKSYNEFYLKEKRHLNRWDLDVASPSNPVKLTHRSGHAHVLNSLALQQVGIGPETGDPPGGLIERDLKTGCPTGLLYGMGGYLSGKVPGTEEFELERGVGLADAKFLSCGVTSVQDASVSNGPDQWRRFESWKERKIFRPRLTMMLGHGAFAPLAEKPYASRVLEEDLRLGCVKIVANRVTGSLEPSREELNSLVGSIHAAGYQAAIHVLEEPVLEAAVDAIERAVRRFPRPADSRRPVARHRIEHCSVSSPHLLQRLARAGGMVVSQPAFLFYEGERYLETVPSGRLEYLYTFDAMRENGLTVGAGSDAPIADPNPLVSIGAAVNRRSEAGRLLPGRGLDLLEAVRMHTIHAAAAGFEENIKGSLSPGKLADFVVLSENPFTVPPDRIKDIRVVMTVLGGEIVWRKS
jgi:predicted amidohydrolase YtcJ